MAQLANKRNPVLRTQPVADIEEHRSGSKVVTVPLNAIPMMAGVRFESADIMVLPRLPLARIRCKIEDGSEEMVLRVDLDKRIFIDHPFGVGEDGNEQEAMRQILEIVAPRFSVR